MTAALDEISERMGPDPSGWSWGRLHALSLKHFLSGRGDLGRLLDRSGRPGSAGMARPSATARPTPIIRLSWARAIEWSPTLLTRGGGSGPWGWPGRRANPGARITPIKSQTGARAAITICRWTITEGDEDADLLVLAPAT